MSEYNEFSEVDEFSEWFQIFLDEKDLPYKEWKIVDSNGNTHFIDSEVVVERIFITSANEKKNIKDVLVKIDFANGDVNHFFHHLAVALTEQHGRI